MEQETIPRPAASPVPDYEAGVDACLSAMVKVREQMARDQVEIDRLREETRSILAQLRAG